MQTKDLQWKMMLRSVLLILLLSAVGMTKTIAQQLQQIKVSEINLSNIGTIEERVFMIHSILEKGYFCYKNHNLHNTIDIYVSSDASDEMSDFDFFYDNLLYDQLDEFSYLDKTMRGELFVQWRQSIDDEVYKILYEDFTRGIAVENATCETAQPFTANGAFSFSAGVNSGSPCGDAYNASCSDPYNCDGISHQGQDNCLYTAPNPAFYYIRITSPGDLNIYMESTPSVDIDFDCWGPFDEVEMACGQLSCSNIVDCSYSGAHTENCHINNAQAGEYYILLITNYSNSPSSISFENTGTGSGGDISVTATVSPIEGGTVSGTGFYNTGETCTLSATANPGYTFVNWTENGTEVSTDTTYSFTVTGDRTLVANFVISGNVEHEYVDLGLPSGTLWATCNVGADTPEEYGNYFSWGETQTKSAYYWSNYQHCIGNSNQLTKYCPNPSFGYNGFSDTLIILLPEDDAATVNWGNDWRIPTQEEWQELGDNTIHTWTIQNGVSGCLFTATNGNSLFIPAAGMYTENNFIQANSVGHYWSSSLTTDYLYPYDANNLLFSSDRFEISGNFRYRGFSVRPIRSASQVLSYVINATASPIEGGIVTGAGTYNHGTTCTLTASANEGYIFVKWTENGTEVSTDATYSFTVTGDRTLAANFTENANQENITFADANVKAICVANWDTNGDGELSYAEAAAVTDLGSVFSNNYSITSFDELQYFTGLTSVSSFTHCTHLAFVTLPNTITSIGYSAFFNCWALESITIPSSVTSIGYEAFSWCTSLNQIIVDSGNVFFDSRENCNAIIETSTNKLIFGCMNTVIPSSVTILRGDSFRGCSGLTSFTLPSTIDSIISNPFTACHNLEQIIVEETNPMFDSRDNCNAIIKTNSNILVSGCKNTVIPDAIVSIGDKAFKWCRYLTSIVIPQNVTSIGLSAFFDCWLSSMTVYAETPPTLAFESFGGGLNKSIPVYVPAGTISAYQTAAGWNEFTNYHEIPVVEENITFADANVKALCVANWDTNGDGELSYAEAAAVTDLGLVFECTSITSFDELQYFTGLTSIGDHAFYICRNLTSIVIPNTVSEIKQYAFSCCYNLASIVFHDSVISIENSAFSDCYCLTSISIPSSVTSISTQAFGYCYGLEQIVVETGNQVYDSRENCNAIINTASNSLIFGCKNTVVPNTVTSIESFAFYGCRGLSAIAIPSSIISIGSYAFYGCTTLTSIIIPQSVISFGVGVFAYCYELGQITVEVGNTVYDSREDCNAVIITASNTLIAGCKNTLIPNTVTYIGDYAFVGCKNMTSIIIPNSITSIGNEAFYYCNGLLSVSIPNSVTSIGYSVFENCTSLVSVSIGGSVASIGNYAFMLCNSLGSINVLAEIPPTLGGSSAFDMVNKSIPVYVPCGSAEAYQSAAYWSEFTSYQEMHCPTVVHFTTTGNWSEPSNWSEGALPYTNDMVFIDAPCQLDTVVKVAELTITSGQSLTLQAGKTLTVTGTLTNIVVSGLIIEDSAQLIHNNTGVQATVKKTIAGYGTSEDKWYFIASPITDSIIPSADNGLLLGNYDLYYCYPTSSDRLEWRNYKSDAFALHNGKGYLYANETGTELSFGGTLAPSHSSVMRTVYYEENNNSPGNGWTFLGNPFACNCYLVNANGNPLTIYKMNTDGAGLVEVLSGPIAPFEGFFYYTTETHDVYFSRTVPTGLSK